MKHTTLLTVLGLLGCAPESPPKTEPAPAASAASPSSGTTAQTIRFDADLTRDGESDGIQIEFLEGDIRKPFSWVLTVKTAKGVVIHSVTRDDAWLEDLFTQYIDDCTGHEACKRKYYFTVLPRIVGDCLKPSTAPWLEESRFHRLEEAARPFLEGKHFDSTKIDAAIAEMKATMSNAEHLALCVPDGPESVDPPMIWVDVVQQFVPYYSA